MNGFMLKIEDHATIPNCDVLIEIDCTNDWYVHSAYIDGTHKRVEVSKAIYADADLCDIINYKVRN